MSRKVLTRTQTLAVLFIAKDPIRGLNSKLTKKVFLEKQSSAKAMGFTRVNELSWEKIRTVLKAMKKKYDHAKFEEMVSLSRTMWRMDNFDSVYACN